MTDIKQDVTVLDRLKTELVRVLRGTSDEADIAQLFADAAQEIRAQDARIAALTKDAEPYAYVRKWHFDGEKPAKVKNENNRWAWPTKFKFVALSFPKCQPDDVPLYTHPPAPELKPLSLDEIHQRYKNLRGNEPPHYIDIYRDAEAALGILRGGL